MKELSGNPIEQKRKDETRRIVGSVFEHGLLQPRTIVEKGMPLFATEDGASNAKEVPKSGSVMNLIDGAHIDAKVNPTFPIDDALSRGILSVFPVLAERADQNSYAVRELSHDILKERANASFLVVVDTELIQSQFRGLGGYEGSIESEKFEKVLIPKKVFEEVKDLSKTKEITIEVVGTTQGKVRDVEVEVPDYKSALERLVNEHREALDGEKKFYFVHGVRLPTNEDIREGRIETKGE